MQDINYQVLLKRLSDILNKKAELLKLEALLIEELSYIAPHFIKPNLKPKSAQKTNQNSQDNNLMPPDKASLYLGLAKETLNVWRAKRVGPPYIKIGRKVLYKRQDLDDYISSNRKTINRNT